MEELIKALEKLNIENCREKADRMLRYLEAILRENENVNLTAITDGQEGIRKHLIDSLSCAELEEFAGAKRIIDVGTGGGFPGVPLAITFPEKQFTLLDSLNKRMVIVRRICEELGIDNVEIIHGRAEDLAREDGRRDDYDLCISRAVAATRTLLELCMPFVKVGGSFVAYKSVGCEEELSSAQRAMELLGAGQARIRKTSKEHLLVVFEKISPTDERYPRRAGKPGKDPL